MDEPAPHISPVRRERNRSPKNREIALDDSDLPSDDHPSPGWDPCFVPGDGSGTREIPLPYCGFDDFFADLPPDFDFSPAMNEPLRVQVVAEGARMINGVRLPKFFVFRCRVPF